MFSKKGTRHLHSMNAEDSIVAIDYNNSMMNEQSSNNFASNSFLLRNSYVNNCLCCNRSDVDNVAYDYEDCYYDEFDYYDCSL